ncbi:hypothetical protein EVAR_87571_1 [Eumeta japonica]|uniref:Uncharacterized protein n=1 Tax=Eumeta variegata TaxID=151549 RepID=A0A4C1WL54_EUMVA|nr:hypothetical protein EVAR_87571_1 [Eumeta japonica]
MYRVGNAVQDAIKQSTKIIIHSVAVVGAVRSNFKYLVRRLAGDLSRRILILNKLFATNFAHGFSCLHELITAATPDTYVRVHSSQQNIFSVAFHFPTKTKHVDAQVLSRATSATSLYYSRAGEATPCAAVTYLPVAAMNVSLERKTPGASLCVCNTQDVLGKLLFNLCTYGLVN